MNHLAHLLLAGNDDGLLAGGILGDFVKGRLRLERPGYIERGIALHRVIDAFTDQHAITARSRDRFDPAFRRYAGIMTDVIFDHFLASEWHLWHSQSLASFSDESFRRMLVHREHFPSQAIQTCERMKEARTLLKYEQPEFVDRSLTYLSGRLKRDNPLAQGYSQFEKNQLALHQDFHDFFPELKVFTDNWKQTI